MSIFQALRRLFSPAPTPSIAADAPQPIPPLATPPIPHPRNAQGPFYVENWECIACGAPEMEAEGLMSHDDANGHCFFILQPETPDQVNAAIRATWASCCGAVRYGGTDPTILTRLAEIECTTSCDHPLPRWIPPAHRTVARFQYLDSQSVSPTTPMALAKHISSLMPQAYSDHTHFQSNATTASFRITWARSKDNEAGHSIRVNIQQGPDDIWTLRLTENEAAGPGTANGVDKALRKSDAFRNLKWFKRDDSFATAEAKDHPY